MNTLDFGKFRFIAGLRVEGTNLDTRSWDNQSNSLSFKGGGDYIQRATQRFATLCLDQQ